MRSTVLQVRGRKSPLLLGGETLGLRCSVDEDIVMYNKCGRGADIGQKLLMRCGQRAQIFCPRHLLCSLEVAATELRLFFVIKGDVWWKRTFLPMVTIVV